MNHNFTIEDIKNGQMKIRIPNLDGMYEDVIAFVKAHQGERGLESGKFILIEDEYGD